MKIECWEDLNNFRYNKKTKNFYKDRYDNKKIIGTNVYKLINKCKECGNPFFVSINNIGKYCNNVCQLKNNHPMKGKKHTDETKSKMSESGKVKFFSEDHRRKMGESRKGKKFTKEHCKKIGESKKGKFLYKNNYYKKGTPLYGIYAPQLEWCENIRRDPKDKNILQVRCSYNGCEKWFTPIKYLIRNRIQSLKGNKNYPGENRFYCSDECKGSCSIYKKTPAQLIKIDEINAGHIPWHELEREVQPELKQMVHERDGWKCIKCGSKEDLHCHHKEGIRWDPLMSADIDMCITVCKDCHKKIHQISGCTYNDMRCEEY